MQFYSAKVRLSGSTMNEVRGVYSAPQILIMQFLHGVEAITDIKKVKEDRINLREYKEQLKGMYDAALVKREQSIDKIFGALGQLPTKLPDDLLEMNGIIDEDDVIAVAKSVTKSDKNANASYLPKNTLEEQRVDRVVPEGELNMDDFME